MKTILTTLTIALFCLSATSQATDGFAQQLKDDSAFMQTDANADDDCYSFKLGKITHEGNDAQQLSIANLKTMLGQDPVIVAKQGCPSATEVKPVGMKATYSNGYIREFSTQEMSAFKDTPDMAEKMLHSVVLVTFTNISFSDEAGTSRKLTDKIFKIK